MDHQAQVLKGFLVRITSKEAEPDEAEGSFAGEFSRLKRLSTKYRAEKLCSTKAAEKQQNVKKNRYKDIMPFDHTRVKLSFMTSDTDTEYINANFIKGVLNQRAYIATQGPLPHTVQDFWRMIWEYNVEIIVMACREFEMGRKKCERYWPEKREEAFVCDPFTIHLESMESKGDYLTRVLKVTYCNSSRTFWQLHYMNWPDHGVPDSIPPILELLQEMRTYQEHDNVPICIHCSAGCGRTGVLCVIDYTWKLLRNQMITEDFNIFNIVQEMRTQRPSMVQTKEQYGLVYKTIKLLFENYLQMMSNHPSAVKVPAPPHPSPMSSDSDLIAPCEELNLDQEEEPHPGPWPRLVKREELTNQETAGGLLPELLCSPAEVDYDDLVSQASQCSPEDTVSHLTECSQQRVQGEWDAQLDRGSSQHAQMVWVAESSPKSLVIPTVTQEDTPTQISSMKDWNTPQKEGMLELEMKLNSPHRWKYSCLLVEDPYFGASSHQDSPGTLDPEELSPSESWTCNPCISTPVLTLNDELLVMPQLQTLATASPASDEDAPPVLPERTPESFVLANGADNPASPASDEDAPPVLPERTPESFVLENGADSPGSPPSPKPPLPERTPESFILATDDDLEQSVAQQKPLSHSPRVGMSSEWCGTSKPPSLEPKKSWSRSKSLRVRLSMLVSPSISLAPVPAHTEPTAPHLPPAVQTESPLPAVPCLPERSLESFDLVTEEGNQHCGPGLEPSRQLPQRIGASSEWAGKSQSGSFLDTVMNRSKSVRTKGSKNDRLSVASLAAPDSVTAAAAGNAAAADLLVDSGMSVSSGVSGERQDNTKSRTKSLKFLKNIRKPKEDHPPAAAHSEPPRSYSSIPGFIFGFGNRFRKPKGPRHQPNTWV